MEGLMERMLRWILLACLVWTACHDRAAARGAAEKGERRLVCYYANWSVYRPGLAKFTPENIDPFLCTHLIYAFAGMNKNYELKPFDSYNDVQLGNYKKFTNLKSYNPKLKLMIAVGGWNEGSKRFSKLVESPSSRLRFVRAAVSFLRKHGFDGLDLDWEYPGSRDGGRDLDKDGYTKLVKELREAFDSENVPRGKSTLLLTMAVPAGKEYIDRGYDVPQLSKYLDFLNLLTYDYHTSHEATVNHHAPLGEEPGLEDWNPNKQLNVEWSVRYYLKLGCDPQKLVLGIPTYGRSFTLADPEETELGAPAEGPGEKGDATREAGYLAYYEICQMIQEDEWELEAPYPEIMGPYAYKENQWVGFDDEDIILEKVKFIVREGLGGGMVWTLDNDDFRGKCYGERSPLISTLKGALLEGEALLLRDDRKSPATATSSSSTTTQAPKKSRTTTTAAPAKTFTTPDPGPPFECEDEGFFNHPYDCKKYFWCLDSGPSNLGLVAHAFTCPSGLHFNKQRDSCDYAANVVCRVKKTTAAPSTTPRPRPKPRTRKTTTKTTTKATTTTTTTVAPPTPDGDKILKEAKDSLGGVVDGQSLMELLNLLQQLGVNQIHDRLHGRESSATNTTTQYRTLPQYRTPDRPGRTASTTEEESSPAADLFVQYAQPARGPKAGGGDPTVRPRGPQFHVPAAEAEVVDHEDLLPREHESTSPSDDADGFDFPFVYHTPSRHRTGGTTTPADVEDDEDEEEAEVKATSPSPRPSTGQRRRVVVKLRPIPGEGRNNKNNNNRYALSQSMRRQRVTANLPEEKEDITTIPPTRRRAVITTTTRVPRTTAASTPRPFRGPPPRKELMVIPNGKPAVPATTRRYHPVVPESRGPALALLPDGGVTCLRRGVHPHPKDCTRFIVCVPSSEGDDELDGFIHECPPGTNFSDNKGRCTGSTNAACGTTGQ